MKVKIFSEYSGVDIENVLNEWLEKNKEIDIKIIKQSLIFLGNSDRNLCLFSIWYIEKSKSKSEPETFGPYGPIKSM